MPELPGDCESASAMLINETARSVDLPRKAGPDARNR